MGLDATEAADEVLNTFNDSNATLSKTESPTSETNNYTHRLSFILAALYEAAGITPESPLNTQNLGQLTFTGNIDKVNLLLAQALKANTLFKEGHSHVELPPSCMVYSLTLPETPKDLDPSQVIMGAYRKGHHILASDAYMITVLYPTLNGFNQNVFGGKSSRGHDLPPLPALEKIKIKETYFSLPTIGNAHLRDAMKDFFENRRDMNVNQDALLKQFIVVAQDQRASLVSFPTLKECVAALFKYLPPDYVPYFGVHPKVAAIFSQPTTVTTDQQHVLAGKTPSLYIDHKNAQYGDYQELLRRARELTQQSPESFETALVHVGTIVLPESSKGHPAKIAAAAGYHDDQSFLHLLHMVLLSAVLPGIYFQYQHFERAHMNLVIEKLKYNPKFTVTGPRPGLLISFTKRPLSNAAVSSANILDVMATEVFNNLLDALGPRSFKKCHALKPADGSNPITVTSITALWKKPTISEAFANEEDPFDLSNIESGLGDVYNKEPSTTPPPASAQEMKDNQAGPSDTPEPMDAVMEPPAEEQAARQSEKRKKTVNK